MIEIAAVIGEFDRLVAVLEADLAALHQGERPDDWRRRPVTGHLRFDAVRGDTRAARLEGELAASLVSVCQRCLQPFEWQLATTISFVLVRAGDSQRVDDGVEVWELDSSDVRPLEIVDEALVMAMPLSVRHESIDDCVDLRDGKAPEFAAAQTGERMTTPFAGLAAQMARVKKTNR